jgi:hypothetical protein
MCIGGLWDSQGVLGDIGHWVITSKASWFQREKWLERSFVSSDSHLAMTATYTSPAIASTDTSALNSVLLCRECPTKSRSMSNPASSFESAIHVLLGFEKQWELCLGQLESDHDLSLSSIASTREPPAIGLLEPLASINNRCLSGSGLTGETIFSSPEAIGSAQCIRGMYSRSALYA